MSTSATHNPDLQIARDNPWYTASQFKAHFSHPSYCAVVERRLGIFEKTIRNWLTSRSGQIDRPIRVLDAGCGDGINLVGLNDLARLNSWQISLVGLDYNLLRVKRAALIGKETTVAAGSIYDLPARTDQFDIIVCNQVLEHMERDAQALSELHRVLDPNGILILCVPNEGCLLAQVRNSILQPRIARTTDHVNFYTGKKLRGRLEERALQMQNLHAEGFFFPHMRLHNKMGAFRWGRQTSQILARMFPSQAAGLIAICRAK